MTRVRQLEPQRVFSTQYTAIMLIILTFVVGAFSQPKKPVIIEQPGSGRIEKSLESPSPQVEPTYFGNLTIDAVFEPETSALRKDQLDGVVVALKSHDIHARFTVYAPGESNSESGSALLVARMISTYRWLESLGVPSHAYDLSGELLTVGISDHLRVAFSRDTEQ